MTQNNEHELGTRKTPRKDKGKEREQAPEDITSRDNIQIRQQPLGEGMNYVRHSHAAV